MARSLRAVLAVGLLLAFSGCVDRQEPTGLAPIGPDYTVADAATGWNPAFYWLPPIVPPFAPSGDFDATSAPIVRICEWSGSSCARQVAEYSLTGGTGGERVTVDLLAEHYQVMWRTGSPSVQPLVVGGTYRISVVLDGRDAGFADARLVGTRRQAQTFAVPGFVPVVVGSNFKIKFRIETLTQLLDLYIDHQADGPLGQEVGSGARTYNLTMTSRASGALQAVYSDGLAAGTFAGERRFARSNPVVRMVYGDADYFAVWAGRQNSDNSVEGAWFDAAGQTGDFRLVGQGETVTRSEDAGTRLIPSTHQAASAGELDGEWTLDFDRTYDGAYVPELGGTNTLSFTAVDATNLTAVYTDGNTGSYQGAVHTARNTSVITLLFTNTDYFAAFAGAMTDPNTIVGVYFDAEGYSGDFVLRRQVWEPMSSHPSLDGSNWYSIGLTVAGGHLVTVGGTIGPCQNTSRSFSAPISSTGDLGSWTEQANYVRTSNFDAVQVVAGGGTVVAVGGWDCGWYHNLVGVGTIGGQGEIAAWTESFFPRLQTGHATVLIDGYIYAIGGIDANCPDDVVRSVTYTSVSGGALGSWDETTPLPAGRRFPSAVALADGRIFVFGGDDDGCDEPMSTIWVAQRAADGTLSGWTEAGTLPRAGAFRFGAAFLVDQGTVIIALPDQGTEIAEFYQGSIVGNTIVNWVSLGIGPDDRLNYAYSNGHVYALGGDSPAVYRRTFK